MRIALFILATATFIVSCEKEKEPAAQVAPTATLTMKINGEGWASEKNTTALVSTLSDDGKTDQVSITGATNGGDIFQLSTGKDVNGPGTYQLPTISGGAIQYWNASKTYVLSPSDGGASITITGIRVINGQKYVKGNFTGRLRRNTDTADKIEITEGEFNGIDP